MKKEQLIHIFYASLSIIFILILVIDLSNDRQLPSAKPQPAETPAAISEIETLINEEKFIKARDKSKELIAQNENLALAYHQLARIEFSLGNVMQAINSTKIAKALDPNEFGYIQYLVNLYRNVGKFNEAYGEINSILAKNPNLIDALVERAETSLIIGRIEDGIADLNRAVDISENSPKALYRRAYFLARVNQLEQAIVDLEAVIQSGDTEFIAAAKNLLNQINQ